MAPSAGIEVRVYAMDVKLVMFKTNGLRKDFPVVNPETRIGRGEDCDFRIPLVSVSRHHCDISVDSESNSLKIKDLGSSNGTFVNNARITETSLHAGDRIAVGPVVFTLQVDGKPEEIQPHSTKADRITKKVDSSDTVADFFDMPGSSKPVDLDSAAKEEEDFDPISALEALAMEKDDDDKS